MSREKRRLLMLAGLLGLVALSYGNSLSGPFTFDDWHVIQENPDVRGPADIPRFFTDPSVFSILEGNRDYRPVFLTSMALSWWAGDGDTLPFHLVSIALHALNTVLLFIVVRMLCAAPGAMQPGLTEEATDLGAFAAAALFAAHPLATESINYISSQSVPLAALFYLASFACFLMAHGTPAPASPTRRRNAIIAASVAYFLALLCKPIAITLPIVLVLWELLFGAQSPGEGLRARSASSWVHSAKRHLPFAGTTLFYLFLRSRLFTHTFGGPTSRPYYDHFLTETRAFALYYLKGVVAPFGLNVDREYSVSHSLFEGEVLIALAILLAVGALLFALRRSRALVFFGMWFFIALLVTTYGRVLGQIVNEHRVYLSLAGACAFLGLGLVWIEAHLPFRISDLSLGRRFGSGVLRGAFACTLVVFLFGTCSRNEVWSSELSLWKDAAEGEGTYRAHMNYAHALEAAGDAELALSEFQRSVELGPYAYPHMNLGLAYLRRGDEALGLEHLRTAARLWPESPEVHHYYAYGLEQNLDLAGAQAELEQALALRPAYARAEAALARVKRKRGELAGAIAEYEERVAQDPDSKPALLFDLAFLLQRGGQLREATDYYEELIALDPDHRQGNFNAAYAYLRSDDPADLERASVLFERVLEIDSTYTEAIFHLATVHWKLGRDETARSFDERYLAGPTHVDLRARAQERLASQ